MKPSVAAVVVTWNGLDWIDACLQSLLSSAYPVEIIVVDNASTDETATYVSRHYPQVQRLANSDNRGFARANNQGITMALEGGAEYVFLLNQDATVFSDTIGGLVAAMQANTGFGVISPVHLNGAGDALDGNFERYGLRSVIHTNPADTVRLLHGQCTANHQKSGFLPAGQITEPIEVTFVNAAAWMISRSCLLKIGGFHPVFFMYAEDHEFLNRAHHAGFYVGILPRTYVLHHRNQIVQTDIGVRKNLTPNYLMNEARLIVLDRNLSEAAKRDRLRRLYWRTVLRSIRFANPGVFNLLGVIRRAAHQAANMRPEAALEDIGSGV